MNDVKDGIKIKLMRLNPPIFDNNIYNYFEINNIMNNETHIKNEEKRKIKMNEENKENKENKDEEKLNLSNELSLCLPINNKKIYIGQNFKSYISISNNFKQHITLNLITIDVIMEKNNFNIYTNTDNIVISSNGCYDFIIDFPILFLNIFTIRCIVEYVIGNEKKKMKKNFNFISKNPFNLKTNIIHKDDKIYIEIFLKNIEEDNIMLNDIKIRDIDCDLIKCNNIKCIHYFKQNDEYSLIFCVKNEQSKLYILNSSYDENISNIEMKFFSNNGGVGINTFYFLKSNIITNNIRIYSNKKEHIFFDINKIYPFEIFFENNTDEDINIEIFIHNNYNIHVINNYIPLHMIEKKKTKTHIFYVICINSGIHFFNKICIYNKTTKKLTDYNNLFKIFVK